MPLTIKHIHGAAQTVVLTQGLPQAVVLVEPVRSWRIESALEERTAANITAVTTFFTIVILLFVNSFRQRRCRAFGLANASVTAWVSDKAIARFLAGVSFDASASAGKD